MGRLDGAVAVVTGAGSGIGAACSERLSTEGAAVVTLDITGDVDHLLDVRDEPAVEAAFDSLVRDHGHLDVVVNAAGVAGGGPVHLLDADEWDRVVDINLKGTFIVDKHSAIHMLARGGGSIINIASIEGLEGTEGGSAYNASKGGVVMLTKSMAIDYGRRGIRVNCICPGAVDTPMLRSIADSDGMDIYREKLREEHLLGRFGRPSEIAAAAAFLASDDASFITGHALVVDGGFTAGLRVGLLEQLGM
ncbi:MAG TPA: SDR family oxidoreductase [Acidimicrobiales bacterium]|jgi:NAD(P)-dependent dehydrogenase (short-subunit alcohol dehydrogenase family)